jgi:uncharacterized protein YjgD (DUF1641 family)
MKIAIIVFAALVVVAGLIMLGVYLKKKGIFDDNNNNHIPDFADKIAKDTTDKINAVLDEAENRIEAIITESKDVAKAVKEVGNQIGDIPKAAAGKKRSGRKQK